MTKNEIYNSYGVTTPHLITSHIYVVPFALSLDCKILVLEVVIIETEMDPAPILISKVVATEPMMEPLVLGSEIATTKQEVEPSVPVSEIVATEQEVDLPIPISGVAATDEKVEPFATISEIDSHCVECPFRRILGSLWLNPRLGVGGDSRSYCGGVITAEECDSRSRDGCPYCQLRGDNSSCRGS